MLPAKSEERGGGAHPVVHYTESGGHHAGYANGFGVSENLNVVSMADETGNVDLFDVQSGERLRTLKTGEPANTHSAAVQCLEWIERDGEDVLLGAKGNQLVEWAW